VFDCQATLHEPSTDDFIWNNPDMSITFSVGNEGVDANADGVIDNDFTIPNAHEGWGRVNLAVATGGGHQFMDEATGLGTDGNAVYPFAVANLGTAFRVSLVWTDFPSTETAGLNLANDLDLVVTGPGGPTYQGNVFSGGWSQTGGGADRVNNVEKVFVQSAAAGTWTAEVRGFNVPSGPQPFALAVGGGGSGPGDTPPGVNIVNPAEGGTVSGSQTVQIEAIDVEDPAGTLSVEWNVDGDAWQPATYNGSTGYYEANRDTTLANDADHTLNARATDSANNVGSDSNNVTVANAPPDQNMHIGDLDGESRLTRNGTRWGALVTITVHDADHNPVTDADVDGEWSVSGASAPAACTTDASGQCQVIRNGIGLNHDSVTFNVTDVSHATHTYQASDNHDPDGDSDGTSIIVSQP
jgi:hypothetical protein